MKTYFQEMFAYEDWSNRTLLKWMEAHRENPELTRVFAHLIAEDHPWLYLLRGEVVPKNINTEPNWTLAECRERLPETMAALGSFVASCSEEDLQGTVNSPGPKGGVFQNTVAEILSHVLNHSEHHRGQMLAIIARETGEYVPCLYMNYLRRAASLPVAA